MFQQFDSLFSMMQVFTDEKKCVDHFRYVRWPKGVVCPHCGSAEVYNLANGTHKCKQKECAQKFSVRYDTIFEDSKISLQKWFMAIYLITSHKKGISSCQLARDIKVTQKSAWFMLHRIRAAIEKDFDGQLTGTVEMDETYVGGKEKNKHANKRVKGAQGAGSAKSKTVVFGMIEREGELRMQKIERTHEKVIKPIVQKHVSTSAMVNTDECHSYQWMKSDYKHVIVSHSHGVYVRGAAYTNSIEGAFGHFKRSIIGVYHQASDKHIDRYLNMFTWRWIKWTPKSGQEIKLALS